MAEQQIPNALAVFLVLSWVCTVLLFVILFATRERLDVVEARLEQFRERLSSQQEQINNVEGDWYSDFNDGDWWKNGHYRPGPGPGE